MNSRELDQYDDDDLEACDVLILSAIEELENSAIERHLLRVGATPVEQTPYEQQYGFKRWNLAKPGEPEPLNVITKCLGSAGNGIAAVELSCFFLKPGMPRLVMFCGIAGSLNPSKAPLASVVVSSQCTWRGFDKISGDDVSREMRKKIIAVEPTDTRIVNLFNALKSEESSGASEYTARSIDAGTREFRKRLNDWHQTLGANPSLKDDVGSFDPEDVIAERIPRLIVGRILSWEYVLNNKSLREEVSGEDRELLAVEMESGACYYAVRRARETLQEDRNTQFVAVRGISDLCNHKADDVFRELAADHAAAVTIGFLYSKFSLRQLI